MNSAPSPGPSSSALGLPAAIASRGYALHSDLAQFCLPAANRDANRKLAYVNSICLLFLSIGLAGLTPPKLEQKIPEPIQEFMPVEIVQPPEPPKTEPQPQEQPPEQQPETVVEMPQVATVVAADPSQVKFAVPVEGPVVFAPAKFAQAPPPAAPKPASRTVVKMTGAEGGSHPEPAYPRAALEQRQQGTVTVIMTVNPDGSVESVEVKTSSGYGTLDRHVTQWVKNKFSFLPTDTNEKRYFEKDFVFQIR
jgi:periplasmic protein TonB